MKRNVLASMATSCICATALAAGLMPGVAFAASPVHILAEQLQPASDTPAMVAGTVDVGGQYMLLMSEADMSFALSTQTNTAALVGVSAKATGQLDVPAAVTADEASYTVDAIGSEKARGGGSPLDPSEEAPRDQQNVSAADAAATETSQLITDADIRTLSSATAGSYGVDAASGTSSVEGASIAPVTSAPNPYITEFYTASQKAYGISSVAIPASVGSIDVAFFQLLPNLAVVTVQDGNAGFSSFNGMLFDSSLASLLLCPGGMEGNAVLPSSLASVPAYVFSRCTKLSAIDFPWGSTATSAFACQDGLLYTADKTTLVAVPPAVPAGTALAPECTSIAAGALPASAALPASGTVIEPDAGTGFAYRVLSDGTLEAIWQGKGVSDVVALPESVVIHGLQLPVTRISPEGEW